MLIESQFFMTNKIMDKVKLMLIYSQKLLGKTFTVTIASMGENFIFLFILILNSRLLNTKDRFEVLRIQI